MQSASEVEEDQNKQDNKNEGAFNKMLICMKGMPPFQSYRNFCWLNDRFTVIYLCRGKLYINPTATLPYITMCRIRNQEIMLPFGHFWFVDLPLMGGVRFPGRIGHTQPYKWLEHIWMGCVFKQQEDISSLWDRGSSKICRKRKDSKSNSTDKSSNSLIVWRIFCLTFALMPPKWRQQAYSSRNRIKNSQKRE